MWVGACPVGINDSPTAFSGGQALRAWPASLDRGVPLAGDSPLTFSQARRVSRASSRAIPNATRDKTSDVYSQTR